MKRLPISFLLIPLLINTLLFAQADPDPERFRKPIEAFKSWDSKNSLPDDYILFVGSSSIRMWKTAEAFPRYKTVNRGFGGAHISDMLFYLNDIALKYTPPQCIVFYCGDNDISGKKNPARVLNDYKKFVGNIHNRFPETLIIYIPAKPSIARWNLWSNMNELNNKIKFYSKSSPLLYYADTATPMLQTGDKPAVDLFIEDGLHLSAKGYAMWNGIIAKLLEDIIK